ncbi:MAG: AAA family ATPase [Candidatus Nanoarchaeia archaeon]|nr:AAA family ATPase [Candidatus Nanoarchaeia archaeon]MDD5238924.1 AAA family ATPase [Candidatus Nanoarchaeia archaeon]
MALESKLEKLCRAEYDNSISDCFEGVPATYMFTPLFKDYETKLVTGDRGVGKTHLFRLLAKEIPIELYALDKKKLIKKASVEYTLLEKTKDNRKPVLVVVDDLHYLLKSMQLYNIKKGECGEEKILDNLEQWKEYAKENKAVLAFVADDSIYGLSERFSKDENKKRFLEFFKKCVHTGEDETVIRKHGITGIGYFNFNLNNRGLGNITDPFFNDDIVSEIWPEELTFYTAAKMKEFPYYLGFSEPDFFKNFKNWNQLKSYVQKIQENDKDKSVSYKDIQSEFLCDRESVFSILKSNQYVDYEDIYDFIIKINENKGWEDTKFNTDEYESRRRNMRVEQTNGPLNRVKLYEMTEQLFRDIKKFTNGRHCFIECPDLSDENVKTMKHNAINANNNRSRDIFYGNKSREINETMRQATKNITRAFNMTDIPLFYPAIFGNTAQEINFNFDSEGYLELNPREIERVGVRTRYFDDEPLSKKETRNLGQIATVRQLKAINEAYGGINRKALGTKHGRPEFAKEIHETTVVETKQLQGMTYTIKELRKLKTMLNNLYHEVIGADSSLAHELLYYDADETVEGILRNSIRNE